MLKILRLSQPFILRNMIRSFSSEKKDSAIDNNDGMDQKTQQYVYTAALITVTFLYAVNLHHIYMGLIHLAMKGRLACNSVIYRKVRNLQKSSIFLRLLRIKKFNSVFRYFVLVKLFNRKKLVLGN